MSNHPLVALIQLRLRRSPRPWPLAFALIMLVLGLVAPPLPPVFMLFAIGAYPAALAARAVSCLGRRLGDLESTRTTPAESVDGLALHLVVSSLPVVLASWLLLSLVRTVPPLAICCALVPLVIYLGLLGWAWSEGEDDMLLRCLLGAATLLPGLLLWLAGLAMCLALGQAWGATAGLILSLALVRWTAILGLRHADDVPHLLKRIRVLTPLALRWEHPVLYREACRTAHRAPLWVLALPGLTLAGLGVGAASWLSRDLFAWTALVGLLLVQTMRASWRTVGCLVDEREGETLDVLMGAPLDRREWADGWALLGALPVLLETLFLGGLWLLGSPAPSLSGAAGLTVLLGLSGAAPFAGVLASAQCATRRQAQDRLGLWLAAAFWTPGLALLLAIFAGAPLLAPLALMAPCIWRDMALRGLGEDPGLERRLRRLRHRAPAGFRAQLLARWEAGG